MLISTPEELRLYAPSNAIDHIDAMAGYFNASEHDFLEEKLGQSLYDALVSYYRGLKSGEGGVNTFITTITEGNEDLTPYAELLSMAQRIVCFDALARAIDMQAISVNGAGINMGVADDYPKADREAVNAYKSSCNKEAHAAINHLLQTLEKWTQQVAVLDVETIEEGSSDEEKKEIVDAWKSSRFFYLAAGLIIPSATILQEYLDIYNSREKFILMLPDLRYIQEDVIAPIIGEDFLDYLVDVATNGTEEKLMLRIIHLLRKAVARHLESRTMQLKVGDPRREAAHNEAVRLTTDLSEYLQAHQEDLTEDALAAFESSPLYVDKTASATENEDSYTPQFENNAAGSVMFVTPSLD